MKIVDGYKSALSFRDLQKILAIHDLRGVGFGNEIFVGDAMDVIHYGLRDQLGLRQFYDDNDDNVVHGFDFYAYQIGVVDADDDLRRDEWIEDGAEPQFKIGNICIQTNVSNEVALQNRQFTQMLGR